LEERKRGKQGEGGGTIKTRKSKKGKTMCAWGGPQKSASDVDSGMGDCLIHPCKKTGRKEERWKYAANQVKRINLGGDQISEKTARQVHTQ